MVNEGFKTWNEKLPLELVFILKIVAINQQAQSISKQLRAISLTNVAKIPDMDFSWKPSLINRKTNFGQHANILNTKDATKDNGTSMRSSNLLSAIHPEGNGYITWLLLVTFCYHYNAFWIPLRESFLKHYEADTMLYWMAVDYLGDLIYLIDLVLVKPRIMFLHEGLWVTNISLTTTNYRTKLRYKLDCVSLLPLDVLYFYYGPEATLLRLPRLLKFHTVIEFYNAIDRSISSPYVLRIGKSLFYIFFLIHLNACAFYKTDAVEKVKDNATSYLLYFYFATKTVVSAGKYRPSPYFTFTIALSCLSGLCVFAFLIGEIYEIYESATKAQREHRDRKDRCVQYLKKLNVPEPMIFRVTDWFGYIWNEQHCFDESRILNFLPHNMKQDVALDVHMSTLSKVELFRGCSETLLRDLVLQLRPVSFLPGDTVMRRGDVGHDMYIVKSGVCCVMSPDEREVLATLREGSVFGEVSLLGIEGARRRSATVRSRGYSSLFALSKTNLDRALRYNREAALVLRRRADQIIRENAARKIQNIIQKFENQKKLRKSQKKTKTIAAVPKIQLNLESS